MKQHLFTIAEGHFYAVVNHVVSHFRKRLGRMNEPMIVGGLAVQLHIMDMTIKAGLSPECSHFRKTDDIDLDFPGSASRGEVGGAIAKIPQLDAEIGGRLINAELVRNGDKKPVIDLFVVGPRGETNQSMKLNISIGPEDLYGFTGDFQASRHQRKASISFSHVCVDEKADFTVVGLEDLIVTKAANGRAKDRQDLSSIADVVRTTGRNLDRELMNDSLNFVKEYNQRNAARANYHDFLRRLDRKPKPASKPARLKSR
ncbi:hypothetical protein GF318_05365 [Candidatus Micrarchaeota archaeon]|nr:hypothetical protein [Candidatus Micrarchaeota archaeon]